VGINKFVRFFKRALMSIVIALLSFVLILLCLFIGLVILIQQPKGDAGMGAAIGGGAMESALGAESGNVLTKMTTYCTIGFFVLCFVLYLGNQYWNSQANAQAAQGNSLDVLSETESTTGDTNLDMLPAEVSEEPVASEAAEEAPVEEEVPAS